MDRRDFLKTTGVAAAVAATSAAPVAAVGPPTPAAAPSILRGLDQLVLGTTFDLDRPGVGDWVRRLAQRLEATSAGRLRLHTVAIASGAIDSAQCADVDITLTSPAEDTGTNAAALVLAGLPGRSALAGLEHAAWLELGGGQILWDEWAGAHGVKPLLAGMIDAPARLVANRRLATAADLAGLRFAGDGIAGRIGTALGAIHVPVRRGDADAALAAGSIDAADMRGPFPRAPSAATAQQIHYASGLGAPTEALMLGIRLGLWERLGPAERVMFEMTAAESLHHSLAESRALLGMGTQIVGAGPRLAPGVGAAIAHATDTVIADLAARSPQARRLIESQQAFAHLVNDVHLRPMA